MKISLFNKPYTTKACFLLSVVILGSHPLLAQANWIGDIKNYLVGNNTQASETVKVSPPTSTMPLLETSVNPDMKNIKDPAFVVIVDDEALSPDNLEGKDSGTVSYISSSDKITTYTIKDGDTLGEIATKFNITKNTILYANTDIKNNVLKVGQAIIILPVDGVSYTIKKGDTIASIAKAYKADANDISEYNDISGGKGLQAGETIIVPGGTVVKKVEPVVVKTEKTLPAQTGQPKTQVVENSEPTAVATQPQKADPDSISTSKSITGGYIWPFPKGVGRVSQRLHDDNAYDIAAPKGTPIYAIKDGTVLIANNSGYNGGYGLYVVIDFDDGAQAIFGHMSKVAATSGEIVHQGDIIGYVGSTGASTGNHVHIGYHGGKPNPYRNLPMNSNGQ